MQLVIPDDFDGRLLRDYLQGELRLSHRLITRLKQTPRGILLDGVPVTVRAPLHAGALLVLATEDATDAPCPASDHLPPLDVLYEDEHILVCNKCGDMPTHPSHGHRDDTLASAVAAYLQKQTGHAGVFRPINRLDRNTSGTVLVAKHQLAAGRLSQDMKEGRIQKRYLAVVEGVPTPTEGSVDKAICRDRQSIILRRICREDEPGAHTALTKYRVLSKWQTNSQTTRALLLATPITGRTHQLRLHFAYLGTPIAGDRLYGNCDLCELPPRQCLHACELCFVHPMTAQPLCIRAPLPDDILSYIPDGARPSDRSV